MRTEIRWNSPTRLRSPRPAVLLKTRLPAIYYSGRRAKALRSFGYSTEEDRLRCSPTRVSLGVLSTASAGTLTVTRIPQSGKIRPPRRFVHRHPRSSPVHLLLQEEQHALYDDHHNSVTAASERSRRWAGTSFSACEWFWQSLLGAVIYSRLYHAPHHCSSAVFPRRWQTWTSTGKCQEKRSDEIGVLGRNLNRHQAPFHRFKMNCWPITALRQDIDRERALEQQRITFFSAASHG